MRSRGVAAARCPVLVAFGSGTIAVVSGLDRSCLKRQSILACCGVSEVFFLPIEINRVAGSRLRSVVPMGPRWLPWALVGFALPLWASGGSGRLECDSRWLPWARVGSSRLWSPVVGSRLTRSARSAGSPGSAGPAGSTGSAGSAGSALLASFSSSQLAGRLPSVG